MERFVKIEDMALLGIILVLIGLGFVIADRRVHRRFTDAYPRGIQFNQEALEQLTLKDKKSMNNQLETIEWVLRHGLLKWGTAFTAIGLVLLASFMIFG